MKAALCLLGCALLVACTDRGTQPRAASSAPSAASASRPASASMGAASASAGASAAAPLASAQVVRATALSQQDLDAGRTIAAQGAPGAAACVSCHGANGEGNAQAGYPRLAGQGRIYLEHQLNSYADGTRAHPVMTPIAGALSAQQRAQVAGFYGNLAGAAPAGQQAAASAPATQEPVLVARGDERRGLQGCANCHGPQGIGDAAATPYLAGQHEPYLVSTLAAWKDGTRHNDPSGQMPAIAKALTEPEARSLAAYFARLPPPAPRNAQADVAVNSTRPQVQSGPTAPTAPAQGTGTQQGAPQMGGSQGQGSGGAGTNPSQTSPGQTTR